MTAAGVTWAHAAPGYETVTFPVMPDTKNVYSLYGGTYYDFFMVDRQGRLAHKLSDFSDSDIVEVAKKARELHAQ